MNEFKHTPGPWLCSGKTVYALNDDGYNRFSALVQDAHTHQDELEANAHLIAAAPELLEALLAIVGDKGVQRVNSDLLNQALTAISKAKGE